MLCVIFTGNKAVTNLMNEMNSYDSFNMIFIRRLQIPILHHTINIWLQLIISSFLHLNSLLNEFYLFTVILEHEVTRNIRRRWLTFFSGMQFGGTSRWRSKISLAHIYHVRSPLDLTIGQDLPFFITEFLYLIFFNLFSSILQGIVLATLPMIINIENFIEATDDIMSDNSQR